MRIQNAEEEIQMSKDMATERHYTEQEIAKMWHRCLTANRAC